MSRIKSPKKSRRKPPKKSRRKSPKKSRRKSPKKSRRKSPKKIKRKTAAAEDIISTEIEKGSGGGYTESPPPPPPVLAAHVSGNIYGWGGIGMIGKINALEKYLAEKNYGGGSINKSCGAISCATMAQDLEALSLDEWIAEAQVDGTSPKMQETYSNQYRMEYFRNFSSRPPVDGETEEKVWTEEPMLEFISKLLESGIYQRGGRLADASPSIFDGCIQISIQGIGNKHGHATIICRAPDDDGGGGLRLIDLQNHLIQKEQGRGDFAVPIIETDLNQIVKYFAGFNCNTFSILTQDRDKYEKHQNILNSRFYDAMYNRELHESHGGGSGWFGSSWATDRVGAIKRIFRYNKVGDGNTTQFLTNPGDLESVYETAAITPGLLVYPYDGIYYNNNKTYSIPFTLDINWSDPDDHIWPNSVKEKYKKYKKLQHNQYPQRVRKAAISAILNGVDNIHLDSYLQLPDEAAGSAKLPDEEAAYWDQMSIVSPPPPPALIKTRTDAYLENQTLVREAREAAEEENRQKDYEDKVYEFYHNLPAYSKHSPDLVHNSARLRIAAHRKNYGNLNQLRNLLNTEVKRGGLPASAKMVNEVFEIYKSKGFGKLDAQRAIMVYVTFNGSMADLLKELRNS